MAAAKTIVSIVMLGKFAPDYFTPQRLLEGKVIPKTIAETAVPKFLIPGDTIQYEYAWGGLTASTNRLEAITHEAPYVRICDLLLKAINDLSPKSTVVTSFGVNVECHYDLKSLEKRNELGIRLAPPAAWGKWGEAVEHTINDEVGGPFQGGVAHLQMRLPFLTGDIIGHRDVAVSPSREIKGNTGVRFYANHHHQFYIHPESNNGSDNDDTLQGKSEILLNFLYKNFETSMDESISIFDGVLSK